MASLAGLAANAPTGPRFRSTVDPYAGVDGSNADMPTSGLPVHAHPTIQGYDSVTGEPRGPGMLAPSDPRAPISQDAPRSLGDYATQYEQSLAASRADIDHQIASALADINTKEARSSQAVGLLPGELKGIYATGNAGLGQTAGSLDAAQKASGLTSFMGAGAEMAPLRGAIAADSAARQADVPLLNIGLAQQAAAEHAALQQQRLSAYADIENQNRQYLAQQAATNAGYAHDAASQKNAADLSLRNALLEAQASGSTSTNPYLAQQTRYQQTLLDKGGLTSFTADQIPAIRSSAQYALIKSGASPELAADMRRAGHGAVVDLAVLDGLLPKGS